ncbi:uncharacterized protein BDV14DRAFT_200806 [Aspergillus stella-maris]|uniref:uncharacterized protein n=1 Tax=Aspergillus stella-maris TaxID=1810926 RepID=UPI003CCDFC46
MDVSHPSLDQPQASGSKSALDEHLSMLEKLPVELVQCITDSLEKDDIICLSLCSHRVLETLGYQHLQEANRQLKASVLLRIAAGLPAMFCCFSCGKLHQTAAITHPVLSPKHDIKCQDMGTLSNSSRISPLWPSLGFNYNFRRCHLLAVMKNHYHGHMHGIKAESLAYTEVQNSPVNPDVTTLLSYEARVCSPDTTNSTLLLQTQTWVLYHAKPNLHAILTTLASKAYICRHQCATQPLDKIDVRQSVPGGAFDQLSRADSHHLLCMECFIEYRIDFQRCGSEGDAIVVTKWLDLGAGLNPDDPEWKRIADAKPKDIPTTFYYPSRNPSYDVARTWGPLSRLFRDASRVQAQKVDAMDRNRGYLLDKQYRGWMYLDHRAMYTSVKDEL